ncbi:hypothetical protein [Bacillus cereus]|uniref:hypothetical protein n=1 Tax=Bacillus cereus TaxID=1396 RepID=UPI001BA5E3BA|nr:hypothetical protein [Bacillus cereus]MBR9698631.1 hypothetical protein [Bacillus cereus]
MTELIFFPKDENDQDFILGIYAQEIKLRTKWIIKSANKVNSLLEREASAERIIKEAMDLIGNAMVILRIIDYTGSRKNELEKAKERVFLIKKKWPNIPFGPPDGLRRVRNDYEHFDAKLDKWAISSGRNVIADMNVGLEIEGLNQYENLRSLNGDVLYFWDKSVSLSEVVEWAKQVTIEVSE